MDEVVGLFPIPLLRAPGLLPRALVDALVAHFADRAVRDNNSSPNLSHSEMLKPADSPLFVEAAALLAPWAGRSRRCGSTCSTPAAARRCTTTPTASSPAWST
jgi:hypothetical protein